MDPASVLKKYSLRDLLPFGFQRAIWEMDQLWSTAIFLLKCAFYGIEAGPGAKIWGTVYFQRFPGSRIRIGRSVRIVSRPYRYALNLYPQSLIKTFSPSAEVQIGDDVGFNSACISARTTTIRIGDGTIIGGNCQIMDTDWHPLWPPDSRQNYPGNEHDRAVEIGRNVFIGLNCIVLKGSRIGDNSVIGAGSVVAGEIPANTLAAGVPAKPIRKLDGMGSAARQALAGV